MTGRERSVGGAGSMFATSIPGRDELGLGDPADRVVRAHDLCARLLSERELLRRLPADVGAEVVHHRLLPEGLQDRELERARDERQPEVEVEDVRLGKQPQKRAPLRRLAAEEAAAALERLVGLGVERVAVEDDELRVDAPPPERPDVRPRDPCGVDGAVDDAERRRAVVQRWIPSAASCSRRRAPSASTIARIVSPIVSPG